MVWFEILVKLFYFYVSNNGKLENFETTLSSLHMFVLKKKKKKR